MALDIRPRKVEADAHSREGAFGQVRHLIEALENLLVVRLVDANAKVLHRDFCLLLLGSHAHQYTIGLG